MRLIGKDKNVSTTHGRVELMIGGVWGALCDNGIDRSPSKTKKVGDVICRQLGHPKGGVTTDMLNVLPLDWKVYDEWNAMKTPVWLYHIECKGDEQKIEKCYYEFQTDSASEHHCKDAMETIWVDCDA